MDVSETELVVSKYVVPCEEKTQSHKEAVLKVNIREKADDIAIGLL